MHQIVLSILANAGGVGKTTLATHLAYELGRKGISVALLDLDPQHALDVFCGLPGADNSASMVHVLSADFAGRWPFVPTWNMEKIQVCQGHNGLIKMSNDLVTRRRGSYILSDRLQDFPLPHQVVILDCPATLGMLCENALAASNFVLVPVQLEMKSVSGAADLVEWMGATGYDLRLNPYPRMLGLVPSLYDKNCALHRQYLNELPLVGEQLGVNVYPPIRESSNFRNASAHGLPIHKHRPSHAACMDFQVIVQDVVKLIKGK